MKNPMKCFGLTVVTLALAGAAAGRANAGLITGTVYELNGSSSAALGTPSLTPPSGTGVVGSAQFNVGTFFYNTNSPGSDNTVGGFLHGPFTSPTGSFDPGRLVSNASNTITTYVSFTGSVTLVAGQIITIQHDDGFNLSIPGAIAGGSLSSGSPNPSPGDSAVVTTSGTFSFTLAYGETSGPPGLIDFLVGGTPIVGTPEPATVAMACTALPLLGLGAWARRRRQKV